MADEDERRLVDLFEIGGIVHFREFVDAVVGFRNRAFGVSP